MQEYLLILRRRRLLILQAFFCITVLGIAITFVTPPTYQATAKLLVDGPSMNINQVDPNNPLSAILALGSQQSVQTQVEVLQTQPLQQRAIQQTGAATFAVGADKDTNIIEVQAESSDPKIAAAAVNELLKDYIAQDADQSLSEIEGAYQFAKQQGADARKRLAAADDKLKTFRLQNHVADLIQNRSDQINRVSALTTELQKDQSDLAVLQARLSADRSLYAQQKPVLPLTLPATNPNIAALKSAIAAAEVQRQSMTQAGGFNPNAKNPAPALRALDAQIAEYKHQLATQPALLNNQTSNPNAVHDTLRAGIVELQAQVSAQQTQVAQTQADLQKATTDLGRYAALDVTLSRLQRDHDQAVQADQSFSATIASLSLKEKARHETAHIIEPALVDPRPVRPKKALNILFSCLIGLFVGICIGLLQEFVDDKINTVEDADRVLGLPSLGRVPSLTAADARLLPQMPGMDPAAESYRILRTNIQFAAVDTALKTLLVTSSGPGEGKTTTAINLAFAMVMDGKKVILLDADLRRPAIHRMLELPVTPGLTDVLLGQADLDDVLMQHSEMPDLMALPSGSTPPNPSELLNSRRFRSLLEELSGQADLVIVDSPPVLAAADAQILAAQADGVVIVIETGETKKAAARQALALLRHARANILGVAYNKMKVLDGAGYYYHYSTPALTSDKSNGTRNGKGKKALPETALPMTAPAAETTSAASPSAEAEQEETEQ